MIDSLKKYWLVIESDLNRMVEQLKFYTESRYGNLMDLPILVLILCFVVSWLMSLIIDTKVKIVIFVLWIVAFLSSILVKLLRFQLNIKAKFLIFSVVFIIGLGLLWHKHNFILFIGDTAIKGFDVESFEVYNSEEYRIESNYVADNWTGKVILNFLDFIFYPSVVLIIYLTWRNLLSNKNRLNN